MTVIGLNIVFGIIVDTFAELRDKKVIKLSLANYCSFSMLAVLSIFSCSGALKKT